MSLNALNNNNQSLRQTVGGPVNRWNEPAVGYIIIGLHRPLVSLTLGHF